MPREDRGGVTYLRSERCCGNVGRLWIVQQDIDRTQARTSCECVKKIVRGKQRGMVDLAQRIRLVDALYDGATSGRPHHGCQRLLDHFGREQRHRITDVGLQLLCQTNAHDQPRKIVGSCAVRTHETCHETLPHTVKGCRRCYAVGRCYCSDAVALDNHTRCDHRHRRASAPSSSNKSCRVVEHCPLRRDDSEVRTKSDHDLIGHGTKSVEDRHDDDERSRTDGDTDHRQHADDADEIQSSGFKVSEGNRCGDLHRRRRGASSMDS